MTDRTFAINVEIVIKRMIIVNAPDPVAAQEQLLLSEEGWNEAFRYDDSEVDLRFYRKDARFIDMKEFA